MRTALARLGPLVLAVSLVPLLLAHCAKPETGDASELAVAEAPPATVADRNVYQASTYDGGAGDRVAKLAADGVVVDGKKIQLAAFRRQYGRAFSIPTKTAMALAEKREALAVVGHGAKSGPLTLPVPEGVPMRADITLLAVLLVAAACPVADIMWTNIGPGGGGSIQSVCLDPADPNRIHLGCDVGGYYRSDDLGGRWMIRQKPGTGNVFRHFTENVCR